jgi:hypothetical protein
VPTVALVELFMEEDFWDIPTTILILIILMLRVMLLFLEDWVAELELVETAELVVQLRLVSKELQEEQEVREALYMRALLLVL